MHEKKPGNDNTKQHFFPFSGIRNKKEFSTESNLEFQGQEAKRRKKITYCNKKNVFQFSFFNFFFLGEQRSWCILVPGGGEVILVHFNATQQLLSAAI